MLTLNYHSYIHRCMKLKEAKLFAKKKYPNIIVGSKAWDKVVQISLAKNDVFKRK